MYGAPRCNSTWSSFCSFLSLLCFKAISESRSRCPGHQSIYGVTIHDGLTVATCYECRRSGKQAIHREIDMMTNQQGYHCLWQLDIVMIKAQLPKLISVGPLQKPSPDGAFTYEPDLFSYVAPLLQIGHYFWRAPWGICHLSVLVRGSLLAQFSLPVGPSAIVVLR